MKNFIVVGICLLILAGPVMAQDSEGYDRYYEAQFYEILGDYDEAKENYQAAAEIFDDDAKPLMADKAREDIERIDKISGERTENLAECKGWAFRGEIKEENYLSQTFETENSEIISLTRIKVTDPVKTEAKLYLVFEDDLEMLDSYKISYEKQMVTKDDGTIGYISYQKDKAAIVKAAWLCKENKNLYLLVAALKKVNLDAFIEDLKQYGCPPCSAGSGPAEAAVGQALQGFTVQNVGALIISTMLAVVVVFGYMNLKGDMSKLFRRSVSPTYYDDTGYNAPKRNIIKKILNIIRRRR